jgi:hypothetical protein
VSQRRIGAQYEQTNRPTGWFLGKKIAQNVAQTIFGQTKYMLMWESGQMFCNFQRKSPSKKIPQMAKISPIGSTRIEIGTKFF